MQKQKRWIGIGCVFGCVLMVAGGLAACDDSQPTGTPTGGELLCHTMCTHYQVCDPDGFSGEFESREVCIEDCLADPTYEDPDVACETALHALSDCLEWVDCPEYEAWQTGNACAEPDLVCRQETIEMFSVCATPCPENETVCDDSIDDDGDGLTDCDDDDCAADAACEIPQEETDCEDAVDNDEDGDTDCADFDCINDPACAGQVEILCDDEQDNDDDGQTDCDDSDCANFPACGGTGWSCAEILACAEGCGEDYQCMLACRDNGCPSGRVFVDAVLTCMGSNCGMDCTNGIESPECQGCLATNCAEELGVCLADDCSTIVTEIDCANEIDDDGDGFTDCTDSDCLGDAACTAELTCAEVLNCADSCGLDIGCRQDCRDAGCQSGQYYYEAYQTCLASNCAMDCASDPQGAQCQGCLDTNCATEVAECMADDCTAVTNEIDCADNIDDDGDGDTDCADPDCAQDPLCLPETLCADSADNDGDGDTDCADTDCADAPICATGTQTCSQVFDCAQACSGDATCVDGCQDDGCSSAQVLFYQTWECLLNACLTDCENDPQGSDCTTCMTNHCADEQAACAADDCSASGVELNCGDGVDDDGDSQTDCDDLDCFNDPACGGGGSLTCSEIQDCAAACGLDLQCRQACPQQGCPSAQTAYSELNTCIQDHCLWDCAQDIDSQGCQDCLDAECPQLKTNCETNLCP